MAVVAEYLYDSLMPSSEAGGGRWHIKVMSECDLTKVTTLKLEGDRSFGVAALFETGVCFLLLCQSLSVFSKWAAAVGYIDVGFGHGRAVLLPTRWCARGV